MCVACAWCGTKVLHLFRAATPSAAFVPGSSGSAAATARSVMDSSRRSLIYSNCCVRVCFGVYFFVIHLGKSTFHNSPDFVICIIVKAQMFEAPV